MNLNLIIFNLLILFTKIQSTVYQSCIKPGDIALTFDGGPSPYTGNLLNILNDKGVKVTFHFSGDYLKVPYVAAYARQAHQDGHLIGLQCKNNLFEIDINNSTFFEELKDLQSKIESSIGTKPTFLRVPYSAETFPNEIVDKLESMGFTLTITNLDTQDYLISNSSNDKSSVFNAFKQQLDQIVPPSKGAFIVGQHDLIAPSVDQTAEIIDYLKEKDYNPVTLDQCIQKINLKNKDKDKDKGKDKNKEDNKKINKGKDSSSNNQVKSDAISSFGLEYQKNVGLILKSSLLLLFLFIT